MTATPHYPKPRRGLELGILLAAAVWYLALANRGLNLPDEGVQLLHGYQTSRGLVTYRDYFVPVAPLGFLIQAGLIKLFGFHLIIGRLYAALQGLIMMAVVIRLSRRHLAHPFALIPPLLLIPYSTALGSFPHYNQDSAFFLLVAVAVMDAYLQRPGAGKIFFAGLLAAGAAASKQSLAAAAIPLVALAVFLGAKETPPRKFLPDLIWAAAGMLLPALALFIWFATTHALQETWMVMTGMGAMKRGLLFFVLPRAALLLGLGLAAVRGLMWLSLTPRIAPVVRGRLAAGLWAAALIGAVLLALRLPFSLIAPLLCGLCALSLLVFARPAPGSDRAGWILLRAFGLLFFVATILSGLDLGHLLIAAIPAVFFAGLLFQDLARKFPGPEGRPLRGVALFGLALVFCLGFYLDLAVPHLAHAQGPRWQDTAAVNLPGLEFMRASPAEARALEQTVTYLDAHSAAADKIFVYPWDLLLYVFADRLPATYDSFLYYEIFDQAIVNRVIRDLEKSKPALIVVRMEGEAIKHVTLNAQARTVEGYLRGHYTPIARYGDFQIMARLRSPDLPNSKP